MTIDSVLSAAGVIIDGRWYLEGADLSRAFLCGVDLRSAYLPGADLSGAYLASGDLSGAYLADSDLRGANLVRTDLRGAHLARADLSEAYLGGADLRWADLQGAELRGIDLYDADLRGAELGGGPITRSIRWTPRGRWPLAIWSTDGGQGVAAFGCQALVFESPSDLRSKTGELATRFATDREMSVEWLMEALRIVGDWKVGE